MVFLWLAPGGRFHRSRESTSFTPAVGFQAAGNGKNRAAGTGHSFSTHPTVFQTLEAKRQPGKYARQIGSFPQGSG